jgi:hypothetical protein
MRNIFRYLFFSLILISCNFSKIDSDKDKILTDTVKNKIQVDKSTKATLLKPLIEKTILGDINGDRIVDTTFIYTPSRINGLIGENDSLPCNGKCFNKVTFSCRFPSFIVEDCIEGKIEAIDDLNGDGNKELIFQTGWFMGTHVNIYVYSLINNNWRILASNWLYFRNTYKHRVRKIDNSRFEFIEETWDAENQVTKDRKRIIKIN